MMFRRTKRPSIKVRENAEFENEEEKLKFKERRCNNCLLQTNLCQLESTHKKKEERLKKVAEHKAYQHLLESPEVRGEVTEKCSTQSNQISVTIK